VNFVTPKALAKQELLFNKPAYHISQFFFNLVAPKARAKQEHFVQQSVIKIIGGFFERLSLTSVAQQSVTKVIE